MKGITGVFSRVLILLVFIAANSTNLYASFNGLTIHSRSNCMSIKESIAWDFTKAWTLWTKSTHIRSSDSSKTHASWTGWETTKRNAIVHWMLSNGRTIVLGTEFVSDCSIYNGWWDSNI